MLSDENIAVKKRHIVFIEAHFIFTVSPPLSADFTIASRMAVTCLPSYALTIGSVLFTMQLTEIQSPEKHRHFPKYIFYQKSFWIGKSFLTAYFNRFVLNGRDAYDHLHLLFQRMNLLKLEKFWINPPGFKSGNTAVLNFTCPCIIS